MIDLNIKFDEKMDIPMRDCFTGQSIENALVGFGVSNNTIRIISDMKIHTVGDFKAITLNKEQFMERLKEEVGSLNKYTKNNLWEISLAVSGKMNVKRTP